MNEPYGYDVVLALRQCENSFGVAPCTATAAVGLECYNCFSTCQDPDNYAPTAELVPLRLTDNHPRPSPYIEPDGGPATLDPDYTHLDSILTGGNLSIEYQAALSAPTSTRSTTSHSSGKWWYEITNWNDQSDTTNTMWAGICLASQELDEIPGGAGSGLGYSVQYGINIGPQLAYTYHLGIRDTISSHAWDRGTEYLMILVDLDAGEIAFICSEIGTPVTFYTGVALATEWFACLAGGGSTAGTDINLGQYVPINTPPAGYDAWTEPSAAPAPYPDGYPCLTRPPKITSAHIKRGEGLAVRGAVTITAQDFVSLDRPPIGLDPYWVTRAAPPGGTFFPRLKTLYPYLQRDPLYLEYYTWSATGARVLQSSREYVFDSISGPDSAGNIIIKGRDLLTLADNDATVLPAVGGETLTAAVLAADTSIAITGGVVPPWPATNGQFVVEDEIIAYGAFDGVTATSCTRGVNNTLAKDHAINDRVLLVHTYSDNVVDVIYDLLVTGAGIDPAHIPYNNDPGNPDEWDIEKDNYLAGHTITHGLVHPSRVLALVQSLLKQCYLHLWYEPLTGLIRLAATNTRVAELQATQITEAGDILAGTLRSKELSHGIITQAWIYYDKYNYLMSDSAESFASLLLSTNADLENVNAWGKKSASIVIGDWLNGAGNIAITTASRMLTENNSPHYELTFMVDGATPLKLGEFISLRTPLVLAPDGTPLDLSCQIVKMEERIPTVQHEVTASILRVFDPDIVPRFANIVNVANESVDYSAADQPSRDAWGWVSPTAGFANGDQPYLIL